MKKSPLRSLAVACTLLLAVAINMIAAPGARAFEAQSTWGGNGGGSANAQTIAIANAQSMSDLLGVPLRYKPIADNTGSATISVNGLTPTLVVRPTNIGLITLSGGELISGVAMEVMFDGTFMEIRSPVDMTPIGKTVEFRSAATPRGTLIEDGSCVSRTLYAGLFLVLSTTYGICDGSTTFGLPFSNGRAFVALDNQGATTAGVLTSGGSGCNGTVIGVCGAQNVTLTLPQLPTGISVSGANSISVSGSNSISVSGSNTISVSGVNTITVNSTVADVMRSPSGTDNYQSVAGSCCLINQTRGTITSSGSNTITATGNNTITASGSNTITASGSNTINAASTNTSGAAHAIVNPISLGRRAIKY